MTDEQAAGAGTGQDSSRRSCSRKGQEEGASRMECHTRTRTREEEQSQKPPSFPKDSEKQGGKQQQYPSPGPQEHGPPFSRGGGGGGGDRLATRSPEKQSRVVPFPNRQDSKQEGTEIDLSPSPRLGSGTTARTARKEEETGRLAAEQLSSAVSSGAWRPVGRAGPKGEPHTPQLPLLRLRLAPTSADSPRAALHIHGCLPRASVQDHLLFHLGATLLCEGDHLLNSHAHPPRTQKSEVPAILIQPLSECSAAGRRTGGRRSPSSSSL